MDRLVLGGASGTSYRNTYVMDLIRNATKNNDFANVEILHYDLESKKYGYSATSKMKKLSAEPKTKNKGKI